jgi:hypothetical protein
MQRKTLAKNCLYSSVSLEVYEWQVATGSQWLVETCCGALRSIVWAAQAGPTCQSTSGVMLSVRNLPREVSPESLPTQPRLSPLPLAMHVALIVGLHTLQAVHMNGIGHRIKCTKYKQVVFARCGTFSFVHVILRNTSTPNITRLQNTFAVNEKGAIDNFFYNEPFITQTSNTPGLCIIKMHAAIQ